MTEKLDPSIISALTMANPITAPDSETRESIRRKLFQRIHEGERDFLFVHAQEGTWNKVINGIDFKLLRRDESTRSFMLRMAAHTSLPPHGHPSDEECIVLEGEVWLNGILCKAGDYHLAPSGKPHDWLRSETGCLLFIRGAI
jgi:quercetin dioxygenase-like cupin family protein